ncbi:hypothetical protein AAMO2058_001341300 [Amorphochlora amoebiformis]
MGPHDRLLAAENSGDDFEDLKRLYDDDERITLYNGKPEDLTRLYLPPTYPNGVVMYDCLSDSAEGIKNEIDFIHYLDRFPYATVLITYSGKYNKNEFISGVTDEVEYPASPGAMRNRDRLEFAMPIYERIIKRGYRFVLGCEARWDYNEKTQELNMGGCLIANPPIGFDQKLEGMLVESEDAMKDALGIDQTNYFWATRMPIWYRKMQDNKKKLPWIYYTTSFEEVEKIWKSGRSSRSKRRAQTAEKSKRVFRRQMAMHRMITHGKERRLMDEKKLTLDSDPADLQDQLVSTVRKSLRWKKTFVGTPSGKSLGERLFGRRNQASSLRR